MITVAVIAAAGVHSLTSLLSLWSFTFFFTVFSVDAYIETKRVLNYERDLSQANEFRQNANGKV